MFIFWLGIIIVLFFVIGMPIITFIWMRIEDPFKFGSDDDFYVLCGFLWMVSIPFAVFKQLGKYLDNKKLKGK